MIGAGERDWRLFRILYGRLMAEGDFEGVIAFARIASGNGDTRLRVDGALWRGHALTLVERNEEAVKAFNEVVRELSEHASDEEALGNLGMAHYHLALIEVGATRESHRREALQTLERLVSEYPDSENAGQISLFLSELSADGNETEAALQYAQRAVAKLEGSEHEAQAYRNLGERWRDIGGLEEAEQAFLGAVREGDDRERGRACYELARLCLDTGRYENCVAWCQEAKGHIEKDPFLGALRELVVGVAWHMGAALYELGRLNEAAQCLEGVHGLVGPDDLEYGGIWLIVSNCRLADRNWDGARDGYRAVLGGNRVSDEYRATAEAQLREIEARER